MNFSVHTDLIEAIRFEDEAQVDMLLQLDCHQFTLDSGLCWASRCGNQKIACKLLNRGANPNAEVWGGFSPLIWAAMFSPNIFILNILIDAGSDVNHCSAKRRQTALHAAVVRGSHEGASILLEAGADPDKQDYMYKTALLHAVQNHFSACVKLLIKFNCNVNLTGWVNGNSMSPLILALIRNNLEITKMLLLAGAKFEQLAIYQTYTFTQYYQTVENHLNLEVRPMYLQHQCRVCIRHLLKPDFLQKLRQMILPNSLKAFLQIEELNF